MIGETGYIIIEHEILENNNINSIDKLQLST
jgi:hypothetical protein